VCPLDVERSKPPKLVIEPGSGLSPALTKLQSEGRALKPKVVPEIVQYDVNPSVGFSQSSAHWVESKDKKLKTDLRFNDPTLPAVLGNNNLTQGRFESLGEQQGMR